MDFNIRLAKRSYASEENFERTQGAKDGSLCEQRRTKSKRDCNKNVIEM